MQLHKPKLKVKLLSLRLSLIISFGINYPTSIVFSQFKRASEELRHNLELSSIEGKFISNRFQTKFQIQYGKIFHCKHKNLCALCDIYVFVNARYYAPTATAREQWT